jgi:DNA-binding MarR family transcriptional regulator
MPLPAARSADVEKTRIMLGLLESVERGGEQSQRRLASELGVALGLVNTYLKRCVNKGLVKVRSVPARRYAYYLTPNGFAEKSRLTLEYLSCSLTLFRQAKKDCTAALVAARERGFSRVAVLGANDLAEIAAICSFDLGVTIVAVVDPKSELTRFIGVPVVKSLDALDGSIDALLVADLAPAPNTIKAAVGRFGANGVLIPEFIGLSVAELPGERV